MPELSSSQEWELSNAVSVYFRLLQVDRAWTEVAPRPNLSDEDLEILGEIARELDQLIEASVDSARTVALAAQIVQPADYVTEDLGLLPDVVGVYNGLVEDGGGVTRLAQQAFTDLSVLAPEEQAELNSQMERLFGGGMVAGDLSRRFMCKFAMGLMIAGGVTIWVPPHVHAGASIAAGVSIATANRCWEIEPFFARLNPAN